MFTKYGSTYNISKLLIAYINNFTRCSKYTSVIRSKKSDQNKQDYSDSYHDDYNNYSIVNDGG